MSAMSLALLLAAGAATAAGAAALYSTRGLRRQITALRADIAAATAERATVPAARSAESADLSEIRAAVADALAEERERELAEARAFWAAQEARDLAGLPGLGDEPLAEGPYGGLFLPRPADLAGLEPPAEPEAEDSPELAAARRRHPRTLTSRPSPRSATTSRRPCVWRSWPTRRCRWRTSGRARWGPWTCTSSPTAPRCA
ncbi:hypothetical protein GCM10020000_48660 [Streptomyces olivoverticillatus]